MSLQRRRSNRLTARMMQGLGPGVYRLAFRVYGLGFRGTLVMPFNRGIWPLRVGTEAKWRVGGGSRYYLSYPA